MQQTGETSLAVVTDDVPPRGLTPPARTPESGVHVVVPHPAETPATERPVRVVGETTFTPGPQVVGAVRLHTRPGSVTTDRHWPRPLPPTTPEDGSRVYKYVQTFLLVAVHGPPLAGGVGKCKLVGTAREGPGRLGRGSLVPVEVLVQGETLAFHGLRM